MPSEVCLELDKDTSQKTSKILKNFQPVRRIHRGPNQSRRKVLRRCRRERRVAPVPESETQQTFSLSIE